MRKKESENERDRGRKKVRKKECEKKLSEKERERQRKKVKSKESEIGKECEIKRVIDKKIEKSGEKEENIIKFVNADIRHYKEEFLKRILAV